MESEYGSCTGNCDDCILECATARVPSDGSEIDNDLSLDEYEVLLREMRDIDLHY